MKQGCLLKPLLFRIVLQLSAREIRQKGFKVITLGKEEVKLFPFVDKTVLYLKVCIPYQKTLRTNKQ